MKINTSKRSKMYTLPKIVGIGSLLFASLYAGDSQTNASGNTALAQTVVAAGQNGVDGVKSAASVQLEKSAENAIKNFLYSKDGVTEVSIQGTTGHTPTYNILLVRPLTESVDKINNTFVQGSVFYENERTTANLGLGYRRLVADKKLLLGLNVFYDQEFPYNHQRMSIGAEARTTVGEINLNRYYGLSDWKTNDDGLEEKALSGYDAQLIVALPYIPTASVRAKTFEWYGIEGGDDIKGQTYSLAGLVYPGLTIEAGKNYYSNSTLEDSRFIKATYSVSLQSKKSSKPVFIDTPYELKSMEDKRFEKVQRENKIVKQVGRSFNVSMTGI